MIIINSIKKTQLITLVAAWLLILSSCHAQTEVGDSLPDNWFYNSGIDSASEFRVFFNELRIAVKENNKLAVASKVNLPITISPTGISLGVNSKEEFIGKYDLIINTKVKEALEGQKFEDIRRYSSGVSIGNGVIWITEVKSENDEGFSLKVYAINN